VFGDKGPSGEHPGSQFGTGGITPACGKKKIFSPENSLAGRILPGDPLGRFFKNYKEDAPF